MMKCTLCERIGMFNNCLLLSCARWNAFQRIWQRVTCSSAPTIRAFGSSRVATGCIKRHNCKEGDIFFATVWFEVSRNHDPCSFFHSVRLQQNVTLRGLCVCLAWCSIDRIHTLMPSAPASPMVRLSCFPQHSPRNRLLSLKEKTAWEQIEIRRLLVESEFTVSCLANS